MKNYEDHREDYLKSELIEENVGENPLELFQKWMVNAINDHVPEPNAMILSTVDKDGQPMSRTMLLKEIFEEGFVFYTNYDSDKGKHIEDNPKVSLLFLWLQSQRQVRVFGVAEKLSEVKSTDYFQKRPRGSQIGAWTSPQSKAIPDRAYLDRRKEEIESKFEGDSILEKPNFWGGYKVIPTEIEFWQGRSNRLHDRLVYTKSEDGEWNRKRLAP